MLVSVLLMIALASAKPSVYFREQFEDGKFPFISCGLQLLPTNLTASWPNILQLAS